MVVGCYQQPEIPRDKPLSCTADEPGQCPVGFSCIDKRICASQTCLLAEDCPDGLVCGRNGCALPGAGDGGIDGGTLGVPPGLPDGGVFPPVPPVPPAPDVRQDAGVVIDLGGGA